MRHQPSSTDSHPNLPRRSVPPSHNEDSHRATRSHRALTNSACPPPAPTTRNRHINHRSLRLHRNSGNSPNRPCSFLDKLANALQVDITSQNLRFNIRNILLLNTPPISSGSIACPLAPRLGFLHSLATQTAHPSRAKRPKSKRLPHHRKLRYRKNLQLILSQRQRRPWPSTGPQRQ